jgi:hypothetical protein
MLKTIEGIYQDGQVRFTELPQDVSDLSQVLSDLSQVLVIFLDPGKINSAKLRQLIDQLETIEGIQQGFEELNSGHGFRSDSNVSELLSMLKTAFNPTRKTQ